MDTIFVPWDNMSKLFGCSIGCACCAGVVRVLTEEELEAITTAIIDTANEGDFCSTKTEDGDKD